MEPWFTLWSFFLLRLLCISISTIQPCMEYYCCVWAGAPSRYLKKCYKLQKRICRTVGPSLAASLQLLTHHGNGASLSLLCRHYFGRRSSELRQLVVLPYYWERATCYSVRLNEKIAWFFVFIPRCYKDVYVNSFFPCLARLWNFLPIDRFCLTYDLNYF